MKLLIADTDQLREHVTVSGDLLFASVKPYIVPAQNILIRYVGESLMDELLTALYTTDPLPTPFQNTLIELMRMPVANLAVLNYAGAKNLTISDVGISRAKTDTMADAFEWQFEGLRATLTQNAYDGIETLLRYLEKHLDLVPAYAQSEEYQYDKNLLVRSAQTFSRHYFIDNSRLVFQTLLPSLRAAQRKRLIPLLGTANLAILLSPDPADLVANNQLELAQQALVYTAISRALRERLVQITDQGIQVMALMTIREQRAVDDKSLQLSLSYFDQEAEDALGSLAALLAPPPVAPLTTPGSRIQGDRIVSF